MTQKEQDKLWHDLSEESKEQMRERYNKPIEDSDPNAEYFRGIRYQTGLMFGKHNLRPSLTYEDVIKELYNISVGTFGIPERDFNKKSDVKPWDYFGVYSKEAQQKVIAIIKLLNVAKFLNKNEDGSDWVPDWNNQDEYKWCLCVDYEDSDEAEISYIFSEYENASPVYFRTKELAEQAVQILGEDVVRTALTTDY